MAAADGERKVAASVIKACISAIRKDKGGRICSRCCQVHPNDGCLAITVPIHSDGSVLALYNKVAGVNYNFVFAHYPGLALESLSVCPCRAVPVTAIQSASGQL